MNSVMRTKLTRNIEYHQAMADYHQGEVDTKKKKAEESPPDKGPMTASASPPQPDPDEKLAATHAEVARQLQELIDKEPLQPAIVTAQQNRPVIRNASPDARPTAGVFH